MTNKIFVENELEERLRLLNKILFGVYGACLTLFILLYVFHEMGQISLLLALIPIIIMFAAILAITKLSSRFNPIYLPVHLANNAEFARKYYSGKLLLDNAYLIKNVIALVVVLMVLMYVIRLVV